MTQTQANGLHDASTSRRHAGSLAAKSLPSPARTPAGQVPLSIRNDELLNAAIRTLLPPNYNFEIHKTIHHIRHYESTCVALQMPEGLTLWATAISDIVERFTDATTVIMGDVTYGACCVDDFTALALGADMLVHYGHSCLVPVDQTSIRTLYVFVEIAIDPGHLHATVRRNFPSSRAAFQKQILQQGQSAGNVKGKAKLSVDIEDGGHTQPDRPTHLVLVATVQFINALSDLKGDLEKEMQREDFEDAQTTSKNRGLMLTDRPDSDENEGDAPRIPSSSSSKSSNTWHSAAYKVTIPQVKPLSPGEILGCTSPKLPRDVANAVDGIIYVGDGRFHLESIMIANPRIPAFRYDPYEKRFVREWYDHQTMRGNRSAAVDIARQSLKSSHDDAAATKGWGLVLGTLGRQGSTKVLSHLTTMLGPANVPIVPILLSELSPQKLSLFGSSLDVFVQTSCPRLSIDWGDAFDRPLLSPYEAAVALDKTKGWVTRVEVQGEEQGEEGDESDYPMDFYADQSRGPWTPRHGQGAKKTNANGVSNRDLLRRKLRRPAEAVAA